MSVWNNLSEETRNNIKKAYNAFERKINRKDKIINLFKCL